MTGDLFLDRDREVWRKVHSGDLVRLTIGGYISPPWRWAWVDEHHGPLVPLVPATDPVHTDTEEAPLMDTIHIFRDDAGGYRWHRKAANGEVISSGEAHTRWHDAQRAACRANQDDRNWTFDVESRGDE